MPRRPSSFADTKLAEDGIQDLFDANCAGYFADRGQRFIKIYRQELWRHVLIECFSGALTSEKRPAQAIMVAHIDRESVLGSQVLPADPRQDFVLELA